MVQRKVLIISYVWPPMEGVGLIRAMKFAKFLPVYGWRPVILTVRQQEGRSIDGLPDVPGMKVCRTDYRDIIEDLNNIARCRKRGLSFQRHQKSGQSAGVRMARKPSLMRELIAMPDEQRGWYRFGVDNGKNIIAEERVEAIFSTSPPETAHLIARRLSKDLGIPWVADLRDLWAEDHFRQRSKIKRLALKIIERRVLKDADAIITVSEPWAETLRRSIGFSAGKVSVIENAFDEEDFKPSEPRPHTNFTITYTGKLHKDKQPVEPFFRVLRDLISTGRIDRDRISVNFHALGYDKPDLAAMAAAYGLVGVVKDLGRLSCEEALKAQKASDVLLFVQWQGKGSDGWYSAKIYDYIGARRPILALAKKGTIVDRLILKTSSGTVAETEQDLCNELMRLYNEFIGQGKVPYHGKEPEITKMTRKNRAGELAGILDRLVESNYRTDRRVQTSSARSRFAKY